MVVVRIVGMKVAVVRIGKRKTTFMNINNLSEKAKAVILKARMNVICNVGNGGKVILYDKQPNSSSVRK